MLKLVWFSAVLITTPLTANAGFIIAGIGAVISTVGGWLAAGGVAGFLANTALALLASAVQVAVARRAAKQQDVFRELQEPDSLPVYRFVYGEGWAPGTPAPVRVKGRSIFACYILNSLPSVGPFTLYLDKRKVEYTGNPFDWSGGGAQGSNGKFGPGSYGPHLRFWIGRGDQTSPPQWILDNAPEHYAASDGWRGRTVIWCVFRAGKDEEFNDRWPSAPPEVIVDGKWTRVWDPRDNTQSASNSSTWKWSRNQALCTLHALMNNPVKPYPIEHLWIDSFKWAADVADEDLPVKVGSPIKKFSVDGVLTWAEGTEIEDQVGPLLAAGASRWIRAFGQLGIMPATYSEPVGTISEVLREQDMVFESLRPEDELFTEAYAEFTSPGRAYESATTPAYKVAGAQLADNSGPKPLKLSLPFVHDHRQGQYVCKIEVMRTRMQKSISFVAPPESVDYLSGANVNIDLPVPYTSRNGVYKIEEAAPAEDPMGLSGGVAFRVPMKVRQDAASIYAWVPSSEEKDMEEVEFDPGSTSLDQPDFVLATSGAEVALESGNAVFPRVQFTFPQVATARITGYEWKLQRRTSTSPVTWVDETSGSIQRDDDVTNLEGLTSALSNGQTYRVLVRSVARWSGNLGNLPDIMFGALSSSLTSKSEWRISNNIVASVGEALTPPPTPVSAVAVASGIEVTYQTPNDPDFASFEIYASNTNNINTASFLFGPITGRNATRSQTETGLIDGQTRYYWARSRDNRGFISAFSDVMSATYEEP